MRQLYLILLLFLLSIPLSSQDFSAQLQALEQEITAVEAERTRLESLVENVKFARIRSDLKTVGLPSSDYIEHLAMFLEYSEPHEQARWVAHIITPDIIKGARKRTNDFRVDPLIPTGTAIRQDYFLTDTLADGTVKYDGFGYDRGHLAPSADFRWSERAMSESYFYSNMSPQVDVFNREGWADLEGHLRGYIYDHPETQLLVVTGPVLEANLSVIERSVNRVAIPKQYFKVALDLKNGQAIGFVMPNDKITYPLEHYAVSVDEVEALTGLDFFNRMPNQALLEATLNKGHWFEAVAQGDVEPLYPPALPKNHFNTIQARQHINSGKEVIICGKVVSSRYSRAGHVWLNLDKQYPNEICSVFIRKENLVHFEGDPLLVFQGKQVAAKGTVFALGGKAVVGVTKGGNLNILEGDFRRQ